MCSQQVEGEVEIGVGEMEESSRGLGSEREEMTSKEGGGVPEEEDAGKGISAYLHR